MWQVLNEEVPLLEDGCWSPDFQDFLGQCLQKDPLNRPTAEALLSHPFVTQVRLMTQLHDCAFHEQETSLSHPDDGPSKASSIETH